jgi:hypothetical protein
MSLQELTLYFVQMYNTRRIHLLKTILQKEKVLSTMESDIELRIIAAV